MTERLRGKAGVQQRKRRMERTHWLCEWCEAKGITRTATVVDHSIPLIMGGKDVDENTRNLCVDCNAKATAEQFGYQVRPTIGADGWPIDRAGGR